MQQALTISIALALLAMIGSVLWRSWSRRRWLSSRQALEDALKACFQATYDQRPITPEWLAGMLMVSPTQIIPLMQRLERDGIVERRADGVGLTPVGLRMAASVVRAHRLLERYLADETGVPATELHAYAHREEHRITADEVNRLDAHLGHPRIDPHGDPIPSEDGALPSALVTGLLAWPLNEPAQIAHIEDEPELLYAQLVAAGLKPGLVIRIIERSAEKVALAADDREVILAPVTAAQIQVHPVKQRIPMHGMRLSDVPHLSRRLVVALDPDCQGMTRRRLLDLGLMPGAVVEPVMTGAFGDPTAYRIRGALLALRREQAALVWVSEKGEA